MEYFIKKRDVSERVPVWYNTKYFYFLYKIDKKCTYLVECSGSYLAVKAYWNDIILGRRSGPSFKLATGGYYSDWVNPFILYEK